MMCNTCQAKAQKIAALAEYFREKAGETKLRKYALMMSRAADACERLTEAFAAGCRCSDPEPRWTDRGSHPSPNVLSNWNHDPAWMRYVNCAT